MVSLGRVKLDPVENADAPAGWWEKAFLGFIMLGQQSAFTGVNRILQGRENDPTVEASDPANVFFVIVTLVGMAILFRLRPHLIARIARLSPLILLTCIFTVASSLWSDAKTLVLKRALTHFGTMMVALYLPTRLGFDGAIRLVARSIVVAAILSLLAGIFIPNLGIMHSPGNYGRWRGIFSFKNPLAQVMGIGVILQYYIMLTSKKKIFTAIFAGLEALLVVIAGSATVLGLIILASAGIAIYTILKRGGIFIPIVVICLAPLAALVAIVIMLEPNLLFGLIGRDSTLTGRTELWALAWQAAQDRPFFGHGFQGFWDSGDLVVGEIWSTIGWLAPNAHNGLLEVALELGAVGVLLVGSLLLQALFRILSLLTIQGAANQMCVSVIVLICVVIHSGTEAVLLRQTDISWFMIMLMSLSEAQTKQSARAAPVERTLNILARARPSSA